MIDLKTLEIEMNPFYEKIKTDPEYMIPVQDLQLLIKLAEHGEPIEEALIEASSVDGINRNEIFSMLGIIVILITRMNRSGRPSAQKDVVVSKILDAIARQIELYSTLPDKSGLFAYYMQGVFETIDILMYG